MKIKRKVKFPERISFLQMDLRMLFSVLVQDFDLMMMLDEFDKSLALIAIEFCLPVEDLLYIAVNQRKEHSEKATIGEQSLIKLKELNWPDFLLYQVYIFPHYYLTANEDRPRSHSTNALLDIQHDIQKED